MKTFKTTMRVERTPTVQRDHTNEFLAARQGKSRLMVLADGTELSVQASEHHYCTPRADTGPYSSVEVAAFVDDDATISELWEALGEPNEQDFHGGLWGYLSVATLNAEIERRGGLAKGQ